MSEHTKEPWKLCTHGNNDSPLGNTLGYHIEAEDGTEEGRLIVWEQITEAEGRRIVACVNACAGIPTETLESDGTEIACNYASLQTLEKMAEQRDKLLALVKRYRKETPLGHQPHMIAHLADEAIAEAEATP